MIQAAFPSAPADAALDAIVRIVAERFRPTRIILFGSRARGNAHAHSDYDVLVEVESFDRSVALELITSVNNVGADVDIVPCATDRLAVLSRDIGMIHYDAVREGIVVYAAPGVAPYPIVPPRMVRETPPEEYPSLRLWLGRAGKDFRSMERESADRDPDACHITFHAHQSAEKYFKAALISHGIKPPLSHELADLLAACPPHLAARDDLARACASLQQFYVSSRYPFEFDGTPTVEPTSADATACVLAARVIRDAVLSDPAIPGDAGGAPGRSE